MKQINEIKIGIATFINALNYGAVLQAYALGEYLRANGYDIFYISEDKFDNIIQYHGLKKIFYNLIARRRIHEKDNKLKSFKKQYFKITDSADNIDILLCGSDQVWNIDITDGYTPLFWGEKCDNSIGYAVSCGEVKLLTDTIDIFSQKVKNFNFISAREKDLAGLIAAQLGRECPVVCDPSLLLSKADYTKIAYPERLIKRDYVLIYQMGKNMQMYSLAKKIAKERQLQIVEINNNLFDYTVPSYPKFYSCSIGEFLALFRDASYVVTNSFHGTAFSLIYEKNFYTVKSKSRNSRIVDLLTNIDLEEHLIDSEENIELFEPAEIDYFNVRKNMEEITLTSKEFLRNALMNCGRCTDV